MLVKAVVKLPRQSADDRLVARVGEAQPARRQAAQVLVGRDDDDRLAHFLDLHGGGDGGGGAAVDDDVSSAGVARFVVGGVGRASHQNRQEQKAEGEFFEKTHSAGRVSWVDEDTLYV